jgi:hypothetical protein
MAGMTIITDVLNGLVDDPEGAQRVLEQFVADQAGSPRDRVARIVRLGEPWPFAKAIAHVHESVWQDAEAANVAEETVQAAYITIITMLEMGGDRLVSLDAIGLHLVQTAQLAGEEVEVMQPFYLAMQASFLEFFKRHKKGGG